MAATEADPAQQFVLDVAGSRVTGASLNIPVHFPESIRTALLTGGWDATSQLLDDYGQVEKTTAALPYMSW